MITIEAAAFWEFKARGAELDLEIAKLRAAIAAIGLRKDALIDAFAVAHGINPRRQFTLEDTDCTVRQDAE